MGVLGLWRGVLRGKSGRRRGANGRFSREIPGFLGWVMARRGDSAHGGHCRARGAKKFFKKGVKNQKLGRERCRKVAWGHPNIGRAGRFLDLESFESGS